MLLNLFYIIFGLGVVMLLTAVVLTFVLHIPDLVDEITGRKARRQIKRIKELNSSTGSIEKASTSDVYKIMQSQGNRGEEVLEGLGISSSMAEIRREVSQEIAEGHGYGSAENLDSSDLSSSDVGSGSDEASEGSDEVEQEVAEEVNGEFSGSEESEDEEKSTGYVGDEEEKSTGYVEGPEPDERSVDSDVGNVAEPDEDEEKSTGYVEDEPGDEKLAGYVGDEEEKSMGYVEEPIEDEEKSTGYVEEESDDEEEDEEKSTGYVEEIEPDDEEKSTGYVEDDSDLDVGIKVLEEQTSLSEEEMR